MVKCTKCCKEEISVVGALQRATAPSQWLLILGGKRHNSRMGKSKKDHKPVNTTMRNSKESIEGFGDGC